MITISLRQMREMQKSRLDPVVKSMVERLRARDIAPSASLSEAVLIERCRAMAVDAIKLGIDDSFDLLRLGEMVFALRPDMHLAALSPDMVDVLCDSRFTGEHRVDIMTLRLAFPVPALAQ
jgi:hypothetical protein